MTHTVYSICIQHAHKNTHDVFYFHLRNHPIRVHICRFCVVIYTTQSYLVITLQVAILSLIFLFSSMVFHIIVLMDTPVALQPFKKNLKMVPLSYFVCFSKEKSLSHLYLTG